MTMRAKLMLVALLVGVILVIVSMVRKRRLELKYVLLWLASDIVLIIFVIFPDLMTGLAKFLGIHSQMNMIFFLGVVFALAIIFSLTVTLSRLSEKVRRMAQIMAMLPEDVQELMKKDMEKEGEEAYARQIKKIV